MNLCRSLQLETPTRVHFLWKQVITRRKKAAIVQCFYAVPFFKLKKLVFQLHTLVINLTCHLTGPKL